MNDLSLTGDTAKLERVMAKLVGLTRADPHNPYTDLEWPECIDGPWMSPELMSIHGTRFEDDLDETTLAELNKWECINFFSLNVSGIRDLLVAMTERLHAPGFELVSEYLHCFVAEENEHMWYFAKFCNDFAGKLYEDRAMTLADAVEPDIDNFLLFIRAVIFEELVDVFNRSMGEDDRLHPFVQELNRIHHLDEVRHIAYGRLYVDLCHRQLREKYPKERIKEIEEIVKRFIQISILKLYSPAVYKDAGLERPARIRKALLSDPARIEFNKNLLAPTARYLAKVGILSDDQVWH
jgi:hypothetical protein